MYDKRWDDDDEMIEITDKMSCDMWLAQGESGLMITLNKHLNLHNRLFGCYVHVHVKQDSWIYHLGRATIVSLRYQV